MNDREQILQRVREATAAMRQKTPLPEYDSEMVVARPRLINGRIDSFIANLTAVNGRCLASTSDLATFLKSGNHLRGYCDPALWDSVGALLQKEGLEVSPRYHRFQMDDYHFGITRATGGIAETGTIVLDDHRTSDRLAALTPWVHIAVLRLSEIVSTIPEAIEMFSDCPNIIWVTGPSKTADIEGILIQGVHGPGEQVCLLVE